MQSDIFCHVSVGTNQLPMATEFYRTVLATLNIVQVCQYESSVAFGRDKYPAFWVQHPYDQQSANCGNGVHIAFKAKTTDEVDSFYRAAIAAGGQCNGKPGPRPDYGDPYYGCFIIDLDGNKIEASFWDFSMVKQGVDIHSVD